MSTLKVGSIQPNSGTKVNITGSTLLITTASGHFSGSFEGDITTTSISSSLSGSLIQGTSASFSVLDVGTITETSAERFKTNITTLDSQIENVSLLKPVSFNWKEDNREDIGLIAEEINEVYPELIGKNPNGEIQGVKYSKLTTILIKSIQELSEKNKLLELRIEKLEK